MNAWITLLSSKNYLPAVLVLGKTLYNTKTTFPLVVGITKDIWSKEIVDLLNRNNILAEKIPKLQYSDFIKNKHKNHSVLNTASKIALFSLEKYDKLIFIDADVYVKENIDDLFNYKDGSILSYNKDILDNKILGMSSMFVFCPKNHYYKEYLLIMNAMNAFDGDFLGKIWFHIRDNSEYRIPEYYMGFVNSLSLNQKTIHLIRPEDKFWLIPEPKFKKTQIEFEYYKILKEIYLTNPEILDIINT